MRWQPIETCPKKDGAIFLVFDESALKFPYKVVKREVLKCSSGLKFASGYVRGATYWMPLKAPKTIKDPPWETGSKSRLKQTAPLKGKSLRRKEK